MKKRFIFKDELCDAVWKRTRLNCQKGTLLFTGDNVSDFNLYRTWCKGCERIQVIERKELEKQFENFVKAIDRELCSGVK